MNQEELNPFVYIKGVMNRGKEVIAELEKRGGVNKWGFCGDSEDCYLFIDEKGEVSIIATEDADWLEEHYTEIKLEEPKYQPKDKELVWAWYDDMIARRVLGFYDATNKCLYTVSGFRGGSESSNYAPYEGEYPEWAKEALKHLED